MKKQFFLMGAVAILGFAACNDNGTSTTTKTDTTATHPGDTTIQTTTTTTTTTKTIHPIANFEHRTFYSVATKKPVKLRVDTVNHYYIDVTTNQQPDYYYYDPATHDTFDYYGRRLNNALVNNNGTWMVDESRLMDDNMGSTNTMTDTSSMSTGKMNNGKMKMKVKDDKTKMKSKSEK
ncbi:MAG: hypothetical protein M3004_12485 [Bacteroidota bacterium]|nr:hypothetical protein [Bacteroidota bacterium]